MLTTASECRKATVGDRPSGFLRSRAGNAGPRNRRSCRGRRPEFRRSLPVRAACQIGLPNPMVVCRFNSWPAAPRMFRLRRNS